MIKITKINRNLSRLLFIGLDLLIVLLGLLILYILGTGGNEYQWNNKLIRYYSSRNLQWLLFFLVAIRFFFREAFPFLGIGRWTLRTLPGKAFNLCKRVYRWAGSLNPSQAQRLLLVILLLSALIKILNAWHYNGFFSGDDVEIHEMSFSRLLGWKDWQAWELRNSFYPLVFIYPIQFFFHYLGVHDPGLLVFAGRLLVVFFSALNIYLVYRISAAAFKCTAAGLAAAFFLAFSQLHIQFSSSVLPRTISSTFILLCLCLLIAKPRRVFWVSCAGIFLGISVVIRFSEGIFIVPCLVYLAGEKRFRDALILSSVSFITFGFLLGVSDFLYWGIPFFSLRNIVRYTLLQKLSSRGYQSPFYYLTHLHQWTNLFILIPILIGLHPIKHIKSRARRAIKNFDQTFLKVWPPAGTPWHMMGWAFIPLLLLSVFPHKEPRYLIPVLPFVAILAGLGLWEFLQQIVQSPAGNAGKNQLKAVFLIFIFLASLLFEMDQYRFRRSESAVVVAKYLRAQGNVSHVAVQQIWRAGGGIYLHGIPVLEDIANDSIGDSGYFQSVLERPGLEYVAFKESDIKKYNYEDLLATKGFREVFLSRNIKRERYRLFRRF